MREKLGLGDLQIIGRLGKDLLFKPHFQPSFLFVYNILKIIRKIEYYYRYLLCLAELYEFIFKGLGEKNSRFYTNPYPPRSTLVTLKHE